MKCNICGKRVWFFQKKAGLKGFIQFHKKCVDIVKKEMQDVYSPFSQMEEPEFDGYE